MIFLLILAILSVFKIGLAKVRAIEFTVSVKQLLVFN